MSDFTTGHRELRPERVPRGLILENLLSQPNRRDKKRQMMRFLKRWAKNRKTMKKISSKFFLKLSKFAKPKKFAMSLPKKKTLTQMRSLVRKASRRVSKIVTENVLKSFLQGDIFSTE